MRKKKNVTADNAAEQEFYDNDSLEYEEDLQYDPYYDDYPQDEMPEGEYYYDDGEYYEDEDYEEAPEHSLIHTTLYMFLILILSLALAVGMWFAADDVLALTKPDQEVLVSLPEDASLSQVAQILKDNGLINFKSLFVVYGKFSHAEEKIGSGSFKVNRLLDYHALVYALSSSEGSRDTVTLTFTEGYNIDQIFTALEEKDVCSVDDLRDVAANGEFDYAFLEGLPTGDYHRLEGFLFPDTYDFFVNDDPQRVVKKLLANFDGKFTEEMYASIETLNADIRSRMEEEGSFSQEEIENKMMTPYKIVTVASLIEKEAGSNSERARIASVIYNRLTTRVHEELQIDATIEYALGEHKVELSQTDLAVDSPYNTYTNKGLPPGPIANPGLSSIMAAIYPETTDYYFYALNSSGTHNFFNTYMEQQEFLTGGTPDDQETTPEEAPAEETPEDETPEVSADAE